jgi:hypothetical protein
VVIKQMSYLWLKPSKTLKHITFKVCLLKRHQQHPAIAQVYESVGSETLPTSIKEKEAPCAKAPNPINAQVRKSKSVGTTQ